MSHLFDEEFLLQNPTELFLIRTQAIAYKDRYIAPAISAFTTSMWIM